MQHRPSRKSATNQNQEKKKKVFYVSYFLPCHSPAIVSKISNILEEGID